VRACLQDGGKRPKVARAVQDDGDGLGDAEVVVVVGGEVVVSVTVEVEVDVEVLVVVIAGSDINCVTVGAVVLSVIVTGLVTDVTTGTSRTPTGMVLGGPGRSATISPATSNPVAMPPRTPTAIEPIFAMPRLLGALPRN
jgi:hypothetical protein